MRTETIQRNVEEMCWTDRNNANIPLNFYWSVWVNTTNSFSSALMSVDSLDPRKKSYDLNCREPGTSLFLTAAQRVGPAFAIKEP